jgi:hypothetical protein
MCQQRLRLHLEQGNIIKIIRADVEPAKDDEFNRWYDTEHNPVLLEVPGVVANWRGQCLDDQGQKYFFLYIHKNLDVQHSAPYQQASATKWAREVRPYLKNFDPRNYQIILPGSRPTTLEKGNVIQTQVTDVVLEKEEEFNTWYDHEFIPTMLKIPGIITVWRAICLAEKGPKYLTVVFQKSVTARQSKAYKKALHTSGLENLRPYMKNYACSNYEILL